VLEKYPDLHFVLASSRARPATKDIRNELGISERPNTESILCNGCVIYDSVGNILWQNIIPIGFITEFHDIVKNHTPDNYMYSSGDDAYMFDENWGKKAHDKYQENIILIDKEEYIKKVKSGESKVNRVCFMVKSKDEVEEIKKKFENIRNKYHLECVYFPNIFLDYMPNQTNKGTGIKQLIKLLNISKDEVLAFGDGNNDIELLKNVGWPVAMANATDQLKSHAKIITQSNAEDGLANLLENIFLKKDEHIN